MRAIYYCPQELVALAFACVKRASALLFGNAQLLRAFNRAISSILVTSHTRKMFVLGKQTFSYNYNIFCVSLFILYVLNEHCKVILVGILFYI